MSGIRIRLLVLGNIVLIPYVWIRFPMEASGYTRSCFRVLRTGRG